MQVYLAVQSWSHLQMQRLSGRHACALAPNAARLPFVPEEAIVLMNTAHYQPFIAAFPEFQHKPTRPPAPFPPDLETVEVVCVAPVPAAPLWAECAPAARAVPCDDELSYNSLRFRKRATITHAR